MLNRFERCFYWIVIVAMCVYVAAVTEERQYLISVLHTNQDSIRSMVIAKQKASASKIRAVDNIVTQNSQ